MKPGIEGVFVLCMFLGDDGFLHVSVCCKLLGIHVLLKGSRWMEITRHEVWTIVTVAFNHLVVAL